MPSFCVCVFHCLQVQAMKQEELAELLDELVEAEQLIASDAAGMLVTKAPMAAGQVPVESWKGLEAVGVRVSVLLPQHAQADHASASGHGYGSRGGATAPAQQQGVSLGLWEHAHVGTSSSELATSKLFWQARADAALAPTVVRLWKWLEGQASAQLVALQKRTCTAGEVGENAEMCNAFVFFWCWWWWGGGRGGGDARQSVM